MARPRREQPRRDGTGIAKWASLTVCPACGKKTYPDKKSARAAAKALYPDDHLSPYKCRSTKDVRPNPAPWHLGHLDERVKTGEIDRRRAYDPKQYNSRSDVVKAIQRVAKATGVDGK